MSAGACPACGADNSCAMVNPLASTDTSCWCRDVPLSLDLLKRLKMAYPLDQCLCQKCLIAFKLAQEPLTQGEHT